MAPVYVSIPVDLSGLGNRPDNSLPPGQGGKPDNSLPGEQPGIDNSLPEIPVEIWPTPPGGGKPTHPIFIPVYPDQGLPGSQPEIDNELPGSQPGPDNTLPTPPAGGGGNRPDNTLPGGGGRPPRPTQPIAPIYVPIYPPVNGGGPEGGQPPTAQPKRK